MKKLFASCAAIALMSAPALAQSTTDPTAPVDPPTTQEAEPMHEFEPEQPAPGEYGLDPMGEGDMETEGEPVEPEPVEPELEEDFDFQTQDEYEGEGDISSEGELDAYEDDASFQTESTFDAQSADVAMEAAVNEAELPEEYSTDDLNAVMLAQMNDMAGEISQLNIEPSSNSFAPATETGTTPETDTYMTPDEAEPYVTPESEVPATDPWAEPEVFEPQPETDVLPESDPFVTPEGDPTVDDTWTQPDPSMPQ